MEFGIAKSTDTTRIKNILYLTSNFQGLVEDLFQGILTSPEMCLKHAEFRKILTEENFSKNIWAVIIDEVHCISQWGGDFRKLYALLEKLRDYCTQNYSLIHGNVAGK